MRQERKRANEEKAKEGTDPATSVTPQVYNEPKGDASSRLNASEEPGENEEKRRVAEKLREREQDS
jgi:hypothetical protein